jgi:hypothetical protein
LKGKILEKSYRFKDAIVKYKTARDLVPVTDPHSLVKIETILNNLNEMATDYDGISVPNARMPYDK